MPSPPKMMSAPAPPFNVSSPVPPAILNAPEDPVAKETSIVTSDPFFAFKIALLALLALFLVALVASKPTISTAFKIAEPLITTTVSYTHLTLPTILLV